MLKSNWRTIVLPLLAALVIVFCPLLLLQENSYIRYEDNLDGEFVNLVLLKTNHLLFSTDNEAVVPNVMNGLSRKYFHSEYNIIRLWFYIFSPFWAYVFNSLMVRLFAFAGMYLLMRDYVTRDSRFSGIIAALFCLIPLYTIYGLSTAGIPLMLWIFLRIWDCRDNWYDYLLIILFSFYSHIAITGPFLISFLVAVACYRHFIRKEKFKIRYLTALTLLVFCFTLANYNLIFSWFFPGDVIPHRKEWDPLPYGFKGFVKQFLKLIANGHSHATSFPAWPVYVAGLIALWKNRYDSHRRFVILIPFIVIFLIALFVSLYPFIRHALHEELHILTTFQLTRFIVLLPLMLFLIAGIVIRYKSIRPSLMYAILSIQVVFILISGKEITYNYRHILSNGISSFNKESFTAFYSTELFSEIRDYIGKENSTYRVASVGLEPAISLYNGFYTLDGYMSLYPLQYKHQFRKIIAPELDKSDSLRNCFDRWGNKCYIFASELQYCCKWNCSKEADCEIENLDIDVNAFKEMGGEYIFSGVPIKKFRDPGFTYLQTFDSPTSKYRVFLYRVNSE